MFAERATVMFGHIHCFLPCGSQCQFRPSSVGLKSGTDYSFESGTSTSEGYVPAPERSYALNLSVAMIDRVFRRSSIWPLELCYEILNLASVPSRVRAKARRKRAALLWDPYYHLGEYCIFRSDGLHTRIRMYPKAKKLESA